ncbi:MAG: hypothetical protein HY866_23435 [Chloroflexi bacterium]|nr:hypothetical protein [Chloroflexota bacterium]
MKTTRPLSFLGPILRRSALRSPQLIRWQQRFRRLYASRYTIGLLFGLGVVRALVFLIAYPPAHGADSYDYFLSAYQYKDLIIPLVLDGTYPLYPLLIYLTHYVLGSIYVLIGFQLLLSAAQGVLFYVGLRPYSPALGFLVALMVISDAQTGILYNFTSTEPLYIFLLSLAFALLLIQIQRRPQRRFVPGDVLLGATIAALILTRPVGRYLIVPLGVLFLLSTRSWWRSGLVLAGFGLALMVFMLFNRVALNRLQVDTGSDVMIAGPVYRSGLLNADNGPASARLIELTERCGITDPRKGVERTRCLIEQTGSLAEAQRLYTRAYRELIMTHPIDYGRLVLIEANDFLVMSGQHYLDYVILPSDLQCANMDTRTANEVQRYLDRDWLLAEQPGMSADQLTPIIRDIRAAMCPPWHNSSAAREMVDEIAFRYRSLSRPHPYLWYEALLLAILLISWARRLALPILAAGAILANHVAISALILNVQPRYVAVTNPYKGVLVLALVFIVTKIMIFLADEWLVRRSADR